MFCQLVRINDIFEKAKILNETVKHTPTQIIQEKYVSIWTADIRNRRYPLKIKPSKPLLRLCSSTFRFTGNSLSELLKQRIVQIHGGKVDTKGQTSAKLF